MSVRKISSLVATLIFAVGLAGCGTTSYYNPATGSPVAVVQGTPACTPNETFGSQVCTCNYQNGVYTNCAFRAVGVAPATPWLDCMLDPNVQYHQPCLATGQQQSAAYYGQGYQRPGSPFWTSGRPAPGYSSTYRCTGRPGDQNCDRMPAR